jgi:hypothetical protein
LTNENSQYRHVTDFAGPARVCGSKNGRSTNKRNLNEFAEIRTSESAEAGPCGGVFRSERVKVRFKEAEPAACDEALRFLM